MTETELVATRAASLSWPQELSAFAGMIRNYSDAALVLQRTYGDVVRVRLPFPAVHFFHPRHVDHVLRTHLDNYPKSEDYESLRPLLGDGIFVSQGETWSRQRKLLSPEFRASIVPQYLPVIVRDLEQLFADRWEGSVGEVRDVGDDFMFFTLRVVGDTIFARDFGAYADAISHALEVCLDQSTTQMLSNGLLRPWMPTPGNLRARRAERDLNAVVGHLIAATREALASAEAPPIGMLPRLLSATDASGRPAMSDPQLVDELKSIILAGHETTSLALGWAFYLLDRHPEARARLEEEADRVLGGRMPGVEDIPRLPYARMVFNESMRLYPPVPTVPRRAREADVIDGIPVAAGEKVLIHCWVTHRHPEFWERPEEFDPERFSPERADKLPRGAFFPFLIGRRACLGEHFAMLEGIAAIAAIAARYRLERIDDRPMGTRPISTMRYERPLRMRVRRR